MDEDGDNRRYRHYNDNESAHKLAQAMRSALPNSDNFRQSSRQPSGILRSSRGGGGGLTQTDGEEAYRRTTHRASKRPKAERMSYLVATGHIDPEETRGLTSTARDVNANIADFDARDAETGRAIQQSTRSLKNVTESTSFNNLTNQPIISSSTSSSSQFKSTSGDINISPNTRPSTSRTQAFDISDNEVYNPSTDGKYTRGNKFNSNSYLAFQSTQQPHSSTSLSGPHFDDAISAHNSFNNYKAKMTRQSSKSKNSKGQFKQSYIEVAMPMMASPAFEYILKRDQRRKKRVCLWVTYSILVTICIALVFYSCTHLMLRHRF